MAKKILVVDDSALMRRVLCDIIESDERFQVAARATNGIEAFDLLSRNQYDAVVLDVNMPKMNGLQLLERLQKFKIPARVLMASTDTREGAKTTLDALELGALDFVHKPDSAVDCRVDSFKRTFLRTLDVVANSRLPVFDAAEKTLEIKKTATKMVDFAKKFSENTPGTKIVAIASSTGGPKALHNVIPNLPAELDAPVLLVQHMPKGFTASLAERLNDISPIGVKEAQEGDELQKGMVYIAMGGLHMVVRHAGGRYTIHYTDEPNREGVKPCANYMYESLSDSSFDKIVCVVMTGMGADGTEGIKNLEAKKKVHVIAQDQATCTVYGMPKSVVNAGMADQVVPLDQIAQEIILNVGVRR
ncbi:MAG: chemotaxis response regulator protein-glutamate methylesterase [Acetatifactor sp.]|nr:chemotaxis response regulator protein-glutamate methylesterase [Acetatifactor sp.]MDE7353756.1 chemotaxis response regulator protein-glutamate methylesterase [Acetatifactor sp.]